MTALIPFEQQFAAAMAEHGLQPGEIVADGKLHRFGGPDEKRGKRSAWYVLHGNGLPAGGFGDWRTDLSETWCAKPDRTMTEVERRAHHLRIEQANAKAAAERAKVAEQAATKCRALWNRAGNVEGRHAYVERKGIKPAGAKQLHGALLIPLRAAGGELRSLQFIQPDGRKRFKAGGVVAGCYCALGGNPGPDAPLLICEGWATACSLHDATGYPIAAAMTAGNMLAVAQALRAKLPDVPMIVCADDDIDTAGNPGLTKAREAALAIGALLAVPDFGSARPNNATDFNDLHIAGGDSAVVACIEAACICKTGIPYNNRITDTQAIESARNNGESTLVETDEQAVARLAAMKPMEYDRVAKAEARRLCIKLSTLDKQVREARGEAKDEANTPFSQVEPWPKAVDGAALLSEIARTVRRFIVCQPETTHAVALWVAMTWCIDMVDVAPIAIITAPEKRCGKSQLLFLIGRLANRPLPASNITPAALFRSIDLWHPTLLIDEADAFMRENEELRGLLNCGHTRESAYTVRVVGDDHTPKMFFVWGAKAIAGIGHLADTLMDRSIALELRRKLPGEQVDKLRHAEPGLFDDLRAKLARWSEDNADAIRMARPSLPDGLHDRAADNWEPLLQIAEVAGEQWPILATGAALKLSGGDEAAQSAGSELLTDIKAVFDRKGVQRISMAALLTALCEDDEAPWKTWNRGKEMTTRQLGKKLREFGIESQPVKIAFETSKGYKVEQFTDAFARYASPSSDAPFSPVTRLQPNAGAGFPVTDAELRNHAETPLVTHEPNSDAGCNRVTEKKELTEEEKSLLPADESEGEL